MNNRVKIIRTSTVPGSLDTFCRGLLSELQQECGYEVVAVSSPGDRLETLAAREGVRTVAVSSIHLTLPTGDAVVFSAVTVL